MVEKLFSLISLGFLTVGFIVCIAGADKDGAKDLANATDQLIQHVTSAQEANTINAKPRNQSEPVFSTDLPENKQRKTSRVVHMVSPSPAVKR